MLALAPHLSLLKGRSPRTLSSAGPESLHDGQPHEGSGSALDPDLGNPHLGILDSRTHSTNPKWLAVGSHETAFSRAQIDDDIAAIAAHAMSPG
jgi:hypothetical protein